MTESAGERTPAVPSVASIPSLYTELVHDDDDLVGLIAYALHKREKRHFVDAFRSAHDRKVEDADMRAFALAASLPDRLGAHRAQAERLLLEFAEVSMSEELDKERVSIERDYTKKLEAAKSWPRAILENALGSIAALAIGALVVVVLQGTRIGFVPMLAEMFGYQVTERPPSASTPAR